ncbi:MAG TPA: OmpH family outer membrane protein [Bryobacteraceae bacterium]|nr:OmpH family outer membrane protein [Bryobacteraceae bacterium]
MTRQVLGFCVLALGLSTIGFAQQKYAVISIQGAIVATKDGQKAAAELDAKAGPKRKDMEGRQNEINSLKDQLQKGQNTLSETAKNDLYRTIDQKTKTLNRDMQDAQDEMDQEQQKLLQGLGQKMMAVIDKYAKENGYTLILDVSNPQTPVLYASNTIDITKDIVELYDKANASGGGAANSSAAPASGTAAPKPAATSTTPAARTTTPAAAAKKP